MGIYIIIEKYKFLNDMLKKLFNEILLLLLKQYVLRGIEIKVLKNPNAVLIGYPGVGKTTMAGDEILIPLVRNFSDREPDSMSKEA